MTHPIREIVDAITAKRDALYAELVASEEAKIMRYMNPRLVANCPSTHCERRGECASPNECTGTGRAKQEREVWNAIGGRPA